MLAIKKVNNIPQQTLGLWEKDTIYLVSQVTGLKIYVTSSDGSQMKGIMGYDDLLQYLSDFEAQLLENIGEPLDKNTGGNVEGPVTFGGPIIYNTKQSTIPVELGSDPYIDCSQGTYFRKTISGDETIALTNVPDLSEAYGLCLMVYFDWGSISFPSNVYFPNDTPLDLSAGKYHLFVMVTDNGGNTWRAAVNSNYAA